MSLALPAPQIVDPVKDSQLNFERLAASVGTAVDLTAEVTARAAADAAEATTRAAADLLRAPKADIAINAIDHGADPTGAADSTTAITNALAASAVRQTTYSDATQAGVVYIPPGTYKVGDIAFAQNGQRIEGAGMATMLKAKAGATAVFKMEGVRQCRLSNMRIDGNAKASNGVRISAAVGVSSELNSIHGVQITNCDYGLDIGHPGGGVVTQVDKNHFEGLWITGCNTAVRIDSINAQEQLFINATLDNCTDYGIRLFNGSLKMISSQFQTAGTTALLINGTTIEWVDLDDVIFEGHAIGIDGSASWPRNGVTLRHCVVEGSSHCVRMGVSTPPSVLYAEQSRFLTGDIQATADDAVFHDLYCELAGGAAWNPTGIQPRHVQWTANGLTLDRGELTASALNSGRTPIVAKALSGQTADLVQVQDSLATPLAGFTATGGLYTAVPIAYTYLALTGHVVNADISAAAAIAYSKLVLTNSIVAGDISGTLKPSVSAAAGTESLRALGTTASTAAAGNDSRLSDSRAPTGAASGDLSGTFPGPTVAKLNGVAAASYALLASPALSGTPTAPTAAVDTNTTQLATMAALLAAVNVDYATYKTLFGRGSIIPQTITGKWLLNADGQAANGLQLTTANSGVFPVYLDPADYSAGSRATKVRLRAWLVQNGQDSAVTMTVSLYPVATWGGAAGANATVATVGAALVTASPTMPAINAAGVAVSAEATLTANYYVMAVDITGTTAASSSVTVKAQLQVRQV